MQWQRERHVIDLRDEGDFISPDAAAATEAIFREHLPNSQRNKIVVHLHGGLNDAERAANYARTVGPGYLDDPDVYPLFLVWRSGKLEVLPQVLLDLFAESKLLQRMIAWAMRMLTRSELEARANVTLDIEALATRDIQPGTKQPVESGEATDELARELAQDDELMLVLQEMEDFAGAASGLESAARTTPSPETQYADRAFLDEVLGSSEPTELELESATLSVVSLRLATAIVRIGRRVWKRHDTLSWNGLRETVVEETLREAYLDHVGRGLWARMKANALGAYAAGKGGDRVAQGLADILNRRPEASLHLIAHSAGSHHASGLIPAVANRVPAQMRPKTFANVFYLAPACDFDLFNRRVVPQANRIHRFRMFTMHRDREDMDTLVPVLYQRSLLCLLTGLLEETPGWPILGMDRYLKGGEGVSFEQTRRFLQGGRRDLVLTPTGEDAAEGERSAAVSHGGFDDDEMTLHSIRNLIRESPEFSLSSACAVVLRHC